MSIQRNCQILCLAIASLSVAVTGCELKTRDNSSPPTSVGLDHLQGIWRCVLQDPAREQPPGNFTLFIDGNRASFLIRDRETIEATFQLDTSVAPMQITWIFPADGDDPEMKVTEIFKLDGNQLKILGNADRSVPENFEPVATRRPSTSSLPVSGLRLFQRKAIDQQ